MERDTTDCETDVEKVRLVIRTREQKAKRKAPSTIVSDTKTAPALDFNIFAEKLLKVEYQNPATDFEEFLNENSKNTQNVGKNNNEDYENFQFEDYEGESTNFPAADNVDEIANLHEEVSTNKENQCNEVPSSLPEEVLEKGVAVYKINPVEMASHPPIGDLENSSEPSVLISCSSFTELIQKIDNLRAIQIQQQNAIEDLKALSKNNTMETKTIISTLKEVNQNTRTILNSFETTEDNMEKEFFGFDFPLDTVEDLQSLDDELGQNSDFKSAFVSI